MTNVMRSIFVILLICFLPVLSFAGEIREFDLKTIEGLGSELARVSQAPDRGVTNAVRKRARETAIAVLQGKLFNIHYDYVVLDDPDGSGYLVYALAQSRNKIVLGGHFRVTVSADGGKAERVDALSHTLLFAPSPPKDLEGQKPVTVSMSQTVSDKPLETCVYTSLHEKVIVSVGMMDGTVWSFVGDKVFKMTPEMMKTMGLDERKEPRK
jgi:hypothetical protein